MTGEPDLHPLSSDEWVTYLKQLMQHYGLWSGDTSPEFTDELADAVKRTQTAYGITPADGVVRHSTWAVLTGAQTSTQTSTPASTPAASSTPTHTAGAEPHPSSSAAAPGHTPAPNGGNQHGLEADPHAQPHQVPASFSDHGLPSFQFTLPEIPVAHAHIDTTEFSVDIELSLTGSIKVTFPHAIEGATVGNEGLEVEAQQAVGHINQGVQIGGIGTDELTIADTLGTQYGSSSYGLDASGAMVFSGNAQVSYTVPTQHGDAEVQGTTGYTVKIHVTPHPQTQEEHTQPVQDEQSWFERHRTLVAVGVVVLVAAAIILTDGAAAPAAAEAAPALEELGFGAAEAF
jgi:hypothetical protein